MRASVVCHCWRSADTTYAELNVMSSVFVAFTSTSPAFVALNSMSVARAALNYSSDVRCFCVTSGVYSLIRPACSCCVLDWRVPRFSVVTLLSSSGIIFISDGRMLGRRVPWGVASSSLSGPVWFVTFFMASILFRSTIGVDSSFSQMLIASVSSRRQITS